MCHKDTVSQSPALQRLGQFVLERQAAWGLGVPDFARFERELHEHVMAIEQECLAADLAQYDVTAETIEVGGVLYRPTLTSPETYLSAAGPVTVRRHLYRAAGRGSKTICPLELRAGIVAGYWTPRAARHATFVMAHLTCGESEAMFAELEGMQPSRSNLDRLPKDLSPRWEAHRQEWEAALRAEERIPPEATVLAVSVDGVMAPLKGGHHRAKRALPGKHASGPMGNREVGCGTVVLYDAQGERVHTIRCGRMPEHKKVTLQQQLQAEIARIVALRPDLIRVRLADGAKDNWRLLAEVKRSLLNPPQPSLEIVDFYHACDHLKAGCDAAWGESTARGKAEFERLKAELTYFRNQRPRMHFADYLRRRLPIASGVMEAACKTLVTQRLKRSGMAWTLAGGQAILTLRSLIQSDRWQPAWELLSADFRKTVVVRETHNPTLAALSQERIDSRQTVAALDHVDYATLPLAA